MTHAEQIKRQVDLYRVIAEIVPLKRKGGTQDYVGICPFHQEKTPSFIVHRNEGYYKCFGCGASGDVIQFEMSISQCNFAEAVKLLADRYGVQLKVEKKSAHMRAAEERARKERYDFLWWVDGMKLSLLAQRHRLQKLERLSTQCFWENRPPFATREQEAAFNEAIDDGMTCSMGLLEVESALAKFEETPLEHFAIQWKNRRADFKPKPWQPILERLRAVKDRAYNSSTPEEGFRFIKKAEYYIDQLQAMMEPSEFEVVMSRDSL